jgi:hypothetical protein
MKLALIPPFSLIDDIFRTDYQMLLPNIGNERYAEAYKATRKRGDYVILDNGAAEGVMPDYDTLMGIAFDQMVNEIVAPDVLGDSEQTIREVLDFDKYLRSHEHDVSQFNFMGVVQGQTWSDVCKVIDFYSRLDWITAIGVPRILCDTLGEPDARVGVVRTVQTDYGSRFQIHLLGTNPRYIRELSRFSSDFASLGVRGVDTSAPYNYANCGKFVDHFDSISRPGEYFHLDAHHFGSVQLKHNLEVMQEWTK